MAGNGRFGWGWARAPFVSVVMAFILIFCSSILDGYGKDRLERTFEEAHPGSTLRTGQVRSSMLADPLTAEPVKLSNTKPVFHPGSLAIRPGIVTPCHIL
jgi:hypothetical protein